MKPIISIKNVNFTYNKGKDNEFQALINVSLDIYSEEYIVVFGPSGCGKSTLLNVIAGLEKPDNGIVNVFDRDLMALSPRDFAMYHRSQVGMVFQAYNLITSLSVLDNVSLPQIFLNVRKHKREEWAKSLLKRFDILKQAKKIPTELSGGQQQRIGIARAIVNNPQIVLADEPVGNLDSVSSKNVLTILKELNDKEKKTIILVTHNPENLEYADRIISMKDGMITGETVNRNRHKKEDKKELLKKSPTTEIQDLMRAYRGLSPEQINILIMPYKAKVFSHHFITSRNMEETKTLEEVIQRRLLGTISLEEFFEILHRPSNEGGVGFDIRTAEKVVRRVNRIIRIAYFIYRKGRQKKNIYGEHDKITIEEKTEKMTNYLLNTCYREYYENLNDIQLNRIKKAVKDRLNAVVDKNEFNNFLDLPFNDGGAGLNSKTARAITEEMELILILGFGISQKQAEQPDEQKEGAEEEDKGKPASNIAGQGAMIDAENEEYGDSDNAAARESSRLLAQSLEKDAGNSDENEKISQAEADKIINEAMVAEDVGGMKDFADVMKRVEPKLKDKMSEAEIAQAVETAIVNKYN